MAEDTSEFPASFTDERGREWQVRLTVPVIHTFCREHKLTLHDLTRPGSLDVSLLLDLAYAGTRYHSRAKAEKQTSEQFLESLDGPSFLAAQGAAANALVNFSLRWIPIEQRAAEKAALEKSLAGVGGTSSGLAESPE
jgi:hypothetical protein